ncbi:MAG: hypothetical protein IIA45_03200 [Bacteroidetes bacterium]|nr:hypothetical protein [Bacteroidota bacterium]
MKNYLALRLTMVFLTLMFATMTKPALSQDTQAALKYLNSMTEYQKKILNDVWDYTSSVAHGKSARKVEKRRKELITTILNAKKNISRMKDFDGEGSLRDSTVTYLEINFHVINYDYGKIVDMEEISEQSYDAMEAYLMAQELAIERLHHAGKIVHNQVELFAATYGIELTESENEISKKMEIAGEVMDYYHVIYLIFFKSYKQEDYFMQALSVGDVNALQQSKNSLSKLSQEGLDKLNEIHSFKGDKSILNSSKKMLKFYKEEADEQAEILVDYYLKRENFEKIKKAFEGKRSSDKTQKDVDQFNEAVNELNEAMTKYNRANDELNKDRSTLINAWNKSVSSFLDRQVPRRK